MTRSQVKEILDRVLSIGEEEWEIIEARAARRDLATDKEVEQVFSRYRRA